MKFRKNMFMLVLVIFLFSIAAAGASDVDDSSLASEDTNQMELSMNDKITMDSIQISEDNDESVSAQTDSDGLSANVGNDSELSSEKCFEENLESKQDNDHGTSETSSNDVVIEGTGTLTASAAKDSIPIAADKLQNNVIVRANNVTYGQETLIEITADVDGTYKVNVTGTVYDVNVLGGSGSKSFKLNAGMFKTNVTFDNDNYITNVQDARFRVYKADINIDIIVYDETYPDEVECIVYASRDGEYNLTIGDYATVINVKDNIGYYEHTILGAGTYQATVSYPGDNNYYPAFNITTFTVYHAGTSFEMEANPNQIFYGETFIITPLIPYDATGTIEYYLNNGTFLGEKDVHENFILPVINSGSYVVIGKYLGDHIYIPATDSIFVSVKPDNTFLALNSTINGNGNPVINLTHDYYFDPAYDTDFVNGIVINRPVTIKGNGHTIDAKGKARIFQVTANDVVLENITFINGYATGSGGAVYFSQSGRIINCNFVDNKATGDYSYGGAVYFSDKGTVSNCNFTGNTATGEGGAINMGSGTVSNCNFADNTATYSGGAVYFLDTGNVTNCNFTDNTAASGGAINMGSGTVSNCNFTDNTANDGVGGAIYFLDQGTVTNCNFTDNTAGYWGGAVYFSDKGTVSNCNFTGNNATTGSAIYFYNYNSATNTVSNSTFLNNRANAEALDVVKNDNNITITFNGQNNLLNAIYSRNDAKVTFTNVTYWGAKGITTVSATMSVSNKATGQKITVGVVVNGKVVLNEVNVTNESGMIVLDISAGENYYISARHDTDSYYTEAERTISNNTKFNVNVTSQTTNNKTVNITAKSNIFSEVMPGKLLFILPNGTQIDAIYGANGTWWAEHTFDDYGEYNVNATYVGLDNVTVNNGTITINKVNSTIALDNIVLDYGESANVTVTTTGATGITANINGTDVTVINNYTIPISGLGAGNYILTVTTIADDNHNPVTKEVTITVNKVSTEITLANETLDLKVNDEFAVLADLTPAGAGNLTYSSSNESVVKVSDEGLITALSEGTSIVTVSFAGNDNYTVAQNKTINVTVSLNDASVSAEDITLDIGANATIGAVSVPEGLKVTYIPDNSGVVTVENGVVTAVKEGTAKITLKVGGDGIYAENSTTITVTVNKINATVDVLIPENVTVGDNSTVNVVLPEDATGNVTVKVDGEVVDTVPVKDGSADVTIPSMSAGNHTVNVSYSGDDNYKSSSKTATLSVAKDSTNLTAANVTATYNINKYLVITLKDSKGNPLANSTVTVDLNGAKNYTTDENGQVKVKVSNLVPKTYSAKITFDGNGNYLGSDATAKVVVKKATPKITANAKTFKTTTKTKKYTITLKDNTGKAIKNAKVYLKVNGKTYKATTNSKGKATFKITKLDKKGTFKATITYKGSKYYNKVTKKANIKVISTWKTISKGSKLKSTVKEIQRALKNNGYYLTAYGHYLMVDGIYWDHTVNAVKQFQKAKGLKVTGKVDEKTAKKLGII